MSKRNREMDFQCDLIRSFDATLKENGIPKGKRKKAVAELTFNSADVIEAFMAALPGSKGDCFPYHEYASGNVDWYFTKGWRKYDKEEKRHEVEEKKGTANPKIELFDLATYKNGVNKICCDAYQWATNTGHSFSGFLGGSFTNKSLVSVNANYFPGRRVKCRIRFARKQMAWIPLKNHPKWRDQYSYEFSPQDRSFQVDFMVDGEVFAGICTEEWEERNV